MTARIIENEVLIGRTIVFTKFTMSRRPLKTAFLFGVASTPLLCSPSSAATWQTVVNNGSVAPQSQPTSATAKFFSYNQPAINEAGQVVFRGRARPATGSSAQGSEPTRGVYTRSVIAATAPIRIIADNQGTLVPSPNTTGAEFIEFPSTPRADALSGLVATRGQSTPVVTLPDGTKVGTSGVYAVATQWSTSLRTAASLVGAIPDYSYFQVPDEPAGTRFDQFPGSPSPLGSYLVAFKGNYTVGGIGKTGVFYRGLGDAQPVKAVLRSGELIPNAGGKVFGSAAPPSAAKDTTGLLKVVFAGFDNEETPTAGGIYSAELDKPTSLRPLVSIGDQVPRLRTGTVFNKFGEGISYGGRYVTFWGAWGSATRIVHKDCPADGNADLIAFCKQAYPNGADLQVPVNQGIFLYDTVKNWTGLVARTGADGYTDFLYWTFSGKPPGGLEEEDAELPRWRSSAFTAVSKRGMVFKAQKTDATGAFDGLYARSFAVNAIYPVLTTRMNGQSVDPAAPAGSLVSAIGVERDGFRGNRVAITASMLNAATTESWAGIYVHDCGVTCTSW